MDCNELDAMTRMGVMDCNGIVMGLGRGWGSVKAYPGHLTNWKNHTITGGLQRPLESSDLNTLPHRGWLVSMVSKASFNPVPTMRPASGTPEHTWVRHNSSLTDPVLWLENELAGCITRILNRISNFVLRNLWNKMWRFWCHLVSYGLVSVNEFLM